MLSFILCLLFQFSPAESVTTTQTTGITITGKVELPKHIFKKKTKRRRRSRSYQRKIRNKQKKATTFTEFDKTVIYLKPLDKRNNVFVRRDGTLIQKNVSFEPAHVVIQKGNKVVFVNEDNLFHNVYSNCCSEKFNIGKKRTGVESYQVFNEENHMQVFCDIHADM